jgi:preprotein translocase subunit YajC
MNNFVYSLLLGAQQSAGTAGEAGARGPMSTLLSFAPFILIIVIFYFLIIRPQSKKQKETQKMLAALKKGDKVVTAGGIHGTIDKVDDSTVVLKVDDYTKIKFSRTSISSVVSQGKEEPEEKKLEDKRPNGKKADEKASGDTKPDAAASAGEEASEDK